MHPRLRTALVMVVLLAVLAGGAAWGWSKLTSPASEETGPCVQTDLEQGDRVRPTQVLVSVLNAGNRSGLASRVSSDLVDNGFVAAQNTNAPSGTDVPRAQIWTDEPRSPAVRLVRSYLGESTVVRRDPVADGVNVVVGDGFSDLAQGRKAARARQATTLCLVE